MTRKATPDQTRDASDNWENEGGQASRRTGNPAASHQELERLGIKSVATTTYEWGGYRYTNAADAIAAAKRAAR
jgi:hypothetical protein